MFCPIQIPQSLQLASSELVTLIPVLSHRYLEFLTEIHYQTNNLLDRRSIRGLGKRSQTVNEWEVLDILSAEGHKSRSDLFQLIGFLELQKDLALLLLPLFRLKLSDGAGKKLNGVIAGLDGFEMFSMASSELGPIFPRIFVKIIHFLGDPCQLGPGVFQILFGICQSPLDIVDSTANIDDITTISSP